MTDELREQLKTEYILTDTSIRKLAAKYGVPRGTLGRIAAEGNWAILRQVRDDGELTEEHAALLPEDAHPLLQANIEAAESIRQSTARLLRKVNQLLDLEDALAPRDLKAISGALLDIKMLFNVKTDEERKEQMLRLKQLEASLSDDSDKDKTVTVKFVGGEDFDV